MDFWLVVGIHQPFLVRRDQRDVTMLQQGATIFDSTLNFYALKERLEKHVQKGNANASFHAAFWVASRCVCEALL